MQEKQQALAEGRLGVNKTFERPVTDRLLRRYQYELAEKPDEPDQMSSIRQRVEADLAAKRLAEKKITELDQYADYLRYDELEHAARNQRLDQFAADKARLDEIYAEREAEIERQRDEAFAAQDDARYQALLEDNIKLNQEFDETLTKLASGNYKLDQNDQLTETNFARGKPNDLEDELERYHAGYQQRLAKINDDFTQALDNPDFAVDELQKMHDNREQAMLDYSEGLREIASGRAVVDAMGNLQAAASHDNPEIAQADPARRKLEQQELDQQAQNRALNKRQRSLDEARKRKDQEDQDERSRQHKLAQVRVRMRNVDSQAKAIKSQLSSLKEGDPNKRELQAKLNE